MNSQFTDLTYPSADEQAEYFPLIDEEGHVIGKATRRYCHGGSMALHPVVHLHIFSSDGRVYLQKRSMKKDIAPGLWDTSVGGHVDYGEHILDALQREAREEVGVKFDCDKAVSLFRYTWQSSREREVVHAFAIRHDGAIQPDHDEVDEGRFWTIEELRSSLGRGLFTQQFEQQELPRLLEVLQERTPLFDQKD